MTFLARVIIRLAACLVPADDRADWRREWLAELQAVAPHSSPLAFALGAPRHALLLRAAGWRPSLLVADLRYGARWLRHRPLFALASIATIALGIGAVTATFGVVYGVLIKPLPFREPDRLVQLWETNPTFQWTEAAIAPGNAVSWRERNVVFSDFVWYSGSDSRQAGTSDLTLEGDQPQPVKAMSVGANFFDVLGVSASLGRTFAAGEDQPGRTRVVVLSDAFWRSKFGADRAAIGTTVRMNHVPFVVIGVMPAGFRFDRVAADMWTPLVTTVASIREVRRPHFMRALARLKPGVTVAQAQQNLSAIAADLSREHPDTNRQMGVGVGPLDDWFVGPVRRPLVALLAAIGLVLVIACANVANLLLVRTSERTREIAVRAAIGASRARLVRQLLTESLLLAIGGAVLGLALAEVGLRAFVALAPAGLPRLDEIGLHPAVALFAVGLAIITTVGVGVAPAWHGARENVRKGLGDGSRTTTAGAHRLRRGLVAAEVALAAVLLVGAMMALRSFRALVSVDAGFPVQGLVTAKISLPAASYRSPGQGTTFFETLGDRLRQEPGVSAAGASAYLPLEGSLWTGGLFIEGRSGFQGHELRHKSVTPGYLEALGLPLRAGRTIAATDRADAPLVVVTNETFARTYFPNGAIGARLMFDDPGPKTPLVTIVGVVGDERQDGLSVPVVPEVYDPESQSEFTSMRIAVRSTLPTSDVVAMIRRDVRGIDPQVAMVAVGAFRDHIDGSVMPERAAAGTIGVFAVCALALALIGVYGVAAGATASRLREIGIRLAFGATGRDVVRLLVQQEFAAVAAGLLLGGVLAAAAGRVVGAMFYGVTGHDAVSFAAGAVILTVAGGLACLIPARRALRVDPARTLRE